MRVIYVGDDVMRLFELCGHVFPGRQMLVRSF